MGRHSFEYKLPGTRKMRTWYVYPSKDTGVLTVQADGICGCFVMDTGKGAINRKCEYPGVALFCTMVDGKLHFPHRDTKPYLWPRDFVELAKQHIPQSGDVIGSSPITGVVRVA